MNVKKSLLYVANWLFSGFRFVAVFLVLSTIPLFTFYYSYVIDCSGFFQGSLELRAVADMLLDGENLVGYEKLNSKEREIIQILVDDMTPTPDTIALGSSRVLQMTDDIARSDNFFNFGITGADVADVMGTFYLFDKKGDLPENVIIGLDPWLLRNGSLDHRSDKEIYTEFLNEKLGYDLLYQQEEDDGSFEALYSPNYFQDNLVFTNRDDTGIEQPQPVDSSELYNQTTEVKCSDGSIIYDVNFRNRTLEEQLLDAHFQTENLLYMQDYSEMDTDLLEQFDKFFAYAKERGVNITILLLPYHPHTYEGVVALNAADPTRYGGFLQTEPAIRELAAKHGITVKGSYNPAAIEGVTVEDFYDGLHCSGNAIDLALWGYTTPDGSSIPTEPQTDEADQTT